MKGHTFWISVLLFIMPKIYATKIGECPETNEDFILRLADSEDCSKYYVCKEGTFFEFSCPEGMYFDNRIADCNHAALVNCGGDSMNLFAAEFFGSGSGDGGDSEFIPPETDWIGECPAKDTSVLVLLPHRYDCGKFFMCYNGTPIETYCPEGLHFNPVLDVCDYPYAAGCIAG